MKDYSIEEMMLEGEAENRGYSKKAKRAFIRYNLALLKHSGKRFDELKKKDIIIKILINITLSFLG